MARFRHGPSLVGLVAASSLLAALSLLAACVSQPAPPPSGPPANPISPAGAPGRPNPRRASRRRPRPAWPPKRRPTRPAQAQLRQPASVRVLPRLHRPLQLRPRSQPRQLPRQLPAPSRRPKRRFPPSPRRPGSRLPPLHQRRCRPPGPAPWGVCRRSHPCASFRSSRNPSSGSASTPAAVTS